jgi:hypothetical protein
MSLTKGVNEQYDVQSEEVIGSLMLVDGEYWIQEVALWIGDYQVTRRSGNQLRKSECVMRLM